MNNVSLVGRLVADPEVKSVKVGKEKKKVCNFTIAIYRSDNATDFVDCACWESRAEFLEDHFAKGDYVAVTGSLQQDKWEDEDGNTRSKLKVLVNGLSFCGNKKD